jgi:hypothetical protein
MTTERRSTLDRMEGYPFPVLLSAGAGGRAEQVATLCERAFHYLKDVLEFTPSLRLLVLFPEDWATHAGFPLYGTPHTAGGGASLARRSTSVTALSERPSWCARTSRQARTSA